MTVNVPPSWNLLLDDRMAEAFTDRVREVFQRAGFDRPIEEVRLVEDPAKLPDLRRQDSAANERRDERRTV